MSLWTRTNARKAELSKLRPPVQRLLGFTRPGKGGTPPGSRALADAIEALQVQRKKRKAARGIP